MYNAQLSCFLKNLSEKECITHGKLWYINWLYTKSMLQAQQNRAGGSRSYWKESKVRGHIMLHL